MRFRLGNTPSNVSSVFLVGNIGGNEMPQINALLVFLVENLGDSILVENISEKYRKYLNRTYEINLQQKALL